MTQAVSIGLSYCSPGAFDGHISRFIARKATMRLRSCQDAAPPSGCDAARRAHAAKQKPRGEIQGERAHRGVRDHDCVDREFPNWSTFILNRGPLKVLEILLKQQPSAS